MEGSQADRGSGREGPRGVGCGVCASPGTPASPSVSVGHLRQHCHSGVGPLPAGAPEGAGGHSDLALGPVPRSGFCSEMVVMGPERQDRVPEDRGQDPRFCSHGRCPSPSLLLVARLCFLVAMEALLSDLTPHQGLRASEVGCGCPSSRS